MAIRRHRNDTVTYRELANYQERVKSFNMGVKLLGDYTRVQLELDVTPRRSARAIIAMRIETLRRAIDRLNRMV